MDTQNQVDLERFKRLSTAREGKVSLRARQVLFARLAALLLIKVYESGYEVTFGDAWAVAGHREGSLHYIRLALDLNLFRDGVYLRGVDDHLTLGEYWESLGGSWGGRWGDGNHYSLEWGGRK